VTRRIAYYPHSFLWPAFLIYLVFYLVPTLLGFFLSFTDWNSYGRQIHFIGLEQFKRLFADEIFLIAFKNTVVYSIGTVLIQNFAAFILALLLNGRSRAVRYFRSVFFFPCILSPVVVAYVFSGIFHPAGLFNQILELIGFGKLNVQWLADPTISMYVIIFVAVWFGTGVLMVIYLAALQNIPEEIIGAAMIDRASDWQLLTRIVIPMVSSSFTINIVYSLIASLKVFALVFLLTDGGPGRATEVFNTFLFKEFTQGRYGYSTAIGLVTFLFICAVSIPVILVLKRREVDA
jgi:raffinose/stachyose/melibiose transport system permease protein